MTVRELCENNVDLALELDKVVIERDALTYRLRQIFEKLAFPAKCARCHLPVQHIRSYTGEHVLTFDPDYGLHLCKAPTAARPKLRRYYRHG